MSHSHAYHAGVWVYKPLKPRDWKRSLSISLRAICHSEQVWHASIQVAPAMKGTLSRWRHALIQTAEQHRVNRHRENGCKTLRARPDHHFTCRIMYPFHTDMDCGVLGGAMRSRAQQTEASARGTGGTTVGWNMDDYDYCSYPSPGLQRATMDPSLVQCSHRR